MAVDKTLIPSPEVIKRLADTMSDYRTGFINDLWELINVPSVMGAAEPGAPYGKEPLRALEVFLEQGKRLGLRLSMSTITPVIWKWAAVRRWLLLYVILMCTCRCGLGS